MRLTYTNLADGTHLPIWCGRRDKFRNISNACRHVRGMHARTHAPRILPCVINYVSSEQKVNLTCKKASPYKKVQVRQGKTKTMEVKGGEKAAQSEERECKRAKCCSLLTLCYYWQTVSQICSVAVSLRYIELWLL